MRSLIVYLKNVLDSNNVIGTTWGNIFHGFDLYFILFVFFIYPSAFTDTFIKKSELLNFMQS